LFAASADATKKKHAIRINNIFFTLNFKLSTFNSKLST